jgi:hypothetical protein
MSVVESWSVFLGFTIGFMAFAYALMHAAREADRMMERRRRDREFQRRWTVGPHRRVE